MAHRNLSPAQVAERLGVSDEWVRREARSGHLSGDVDDSKKRRTYRFSGEDVAAYERKRKRREWPGDDGTHELSTAAVDQALLEGRVGDLEAEVAFLRGQVELAQAHLRATNAENDRLKEALRALIADAPT